MKNICRGYVRRHGRKFDEKNGITPCTMISWKGGRVVDGDGLENR